MNADYLCTKGRFLWDVRDHHIRLIQDDGIHRYVRFRRPKSITYWFDLITWPGNLCISADCGTYVFSRVEDMFTFFRKDKELGEPGINPGYWGEKLQSVGTNAGYKEFSGEEFKERVTDHFNEYWEDTEYQDEKDECWSEVENVLDYENEHEAYRQVQEFRFGYGGIFKEWGHQRKSRKYFTFVDFFDAGSTEQFTFHYIWCLYAIVWGIQEYDRLKSSDGNTSERLD